MSLYDKITDRNTAILNLSNIYVSSNVITGYLAPYDLITDRQAAINTVNDSIGNINNTLNTCLKTTDIQSGDIGLYSAPGGSFLNIVFNATHFKDVASGAGDDSGGWRCQCHSLPRRSHGGNPDNLNQWHWQTRAR